MSGWKNILKRLFCLTLLVAGFAACGQGGTEIGNPNLPSGGQAPASADDGGPAAAPSLEGASPTPSPQSFLIEDSPSGEEDLEEGALIDPEET